MLPAQTANDSTIQIQKNTNNTVKQTVRRKMDRKSTVRRHALTVHHLLCHFTQAISTAFYFIQATRYCDVKASDTVAPIINRFSLVLIFTSNVTTTIDVRSTSARLFASTWRLLLSVITTLYYVAIFSSSCVASQTEALAIRNTLPVFLWLPEHEHAKKLSQE